MCICVCVCVYVCMDGWMYVCMNRRQSGGEIALEMASVFCEFASEKLFAFKVVTLMKQYVFSVTSEEEMMKWITSIQRASHSSPK